VPAAPSHLAQSPASGVQIEVAVPSPPITVRGAGASHLFYELRLINAAVRFRERPVRENRPYAISSSFLALPPRMASLSLSLRNFAFSTKSTPTGQSYG